MSRREQRREVREGGRRRRRGGTGRGPVSVQRAARTVIDTADTARTGAARAFAGDRPYLLGLVGLFVLAGLMLAAPFQTYLDGRDRVENLEQKLSALQAENGALQQRQTDLQDPENIEVLAREQFGLVQPGDVAYVIVPPENERPQIVPAPPDESTDSVWYRRMFDGLRGLFD